MTRAENKIDSSYEIWKKFIAFCRQRRINPPGAIDEALATWMVYTRMKEEMKENGSARTKSKADK